VQPMMPVSWANSPVHSPMQSAGAMPQWRQSDSVLNALAQGTIHRPAPLYPPIPDQHQCRCKIGPFPRPNKGCPRQSRHRRSHSPWLRQSCRRVYRRRPCRPTRRNHKYCKHPPVNSLLR
jgi:hypothetical protein